MPYLLNVIYAALIFAASPWLLWSAIRKGKYREGFAEKFLGRVPSREGQRPCIWLHAVSVGEVNLLATLLAEVEARRPDVDCVISTTTMTGYALAKKKYAPRMVFYCPLDFTWAVNHAMQRIRPDLLLLGELELWPNLIDAATRRGAKVAVINGRLSEKSHRGYQKIRTLLRPVLKQIDLIAAQNEEYARRFRYLAGLNSLSLGEGVGEGNDTPRPAIEVSGSLKFDGAQTNRDNPNTRNLAALAGIEPSEVVFLAGSTQSPEEGLALTTLQALVLTHPNLRLIIVPRHPDRFDEVAALIEQSGLRWRRRSQLMQGDSQQANPWQVLLVDTIGELGAWWGRADIAYVGGSMGQRGGQNMIEPAAYGAAVSFGPKTKNFRDVVSQLLTADAAVVVDDGDHLTQFVQRCLEDTTFANDLGHRAKALVKSQLGATRRTVDLVEPLLPAARRDRLAA